VGPVCVNDSAAICMHSPADGSSDACATGAAASGSLDSRYCHVCGPVHLIDILSVAGIDATFFRDLADAGTIAKRTLTFSQTHIWNVLLPMPGLRMPIL
jgi:hypothetical protein